MNNSCIKTNKMDNQQLFNLRSQINLTEPELQLCLSLYLGDGSFVKQTVNGNYGIHTSCIYKESLNFKKSLVTNLITSDIKEVENNGYKKGGRIFKMHFHSNPEISKVFNLSLSEKVHLLNDLGLALWFYDDGSLHKDKLFYNLNTHAFTVEDQLEMLEVLKKFSIYGKITSETKKDGRKFFYIAVSKYSGSFEIANILTKYKINEMSYKLWSSETIQTWSTFQEEWKSKGNQESDFKRFMMKKIRSFLSENKNLDFKI